MNVLLAAAALTLASSIHCVGMCGGFAASVAGTGGRRPWPLLRHQILLQLGKTSAYVFLGALAGALGAAVVRHPAFLLGERVLAVAAGVLILAAGLKLLGVSRGRPASSALFSSFFSRLVSPLLSARPRGFALVVGLLMGFLPCPLVYAALGAAAVSAHAASGALILAGTALGTIPALLGVAAFGAAVPHVWRQGLARAAGVLLLAVALVTLGRGLAPGPLHAGHHGMDHGSATASAGAAACDRGP